MVLVLAILSILTPGLASAAISPRSAQSVEAQEGTWYSVLGGDTLFSIAQRFGVTVSAIVRANDIANPNLIRPGQRLWIPNASGTPQPTPTPPSSEGAWYVVQRGESLSSIARRFGVTVSAILQANTILNPDFLRVSQSIWIPGTAEAPAPTQPPTPGGSPPPAPLDAEGFWYTVQRGENLSAIAQRFGVTVSAILQANTIPNPNFLRVSQSIWIPGSSSAQPLPSQPAQPAEPAQPPAAGTANVVIQSIFYDGLAYQTEHDEYAVIANTGTAAINIGGWRLNAGDPGQDFVFPSFELQPGQACRVYTDEVQPESCGFSFGSGRALWNNEGDCGYLYNSSGEQVSQYCY